MKGDPKERKKLELKLMCKLVTLLLLHFLHFSNFRLLGNLPDPDPPHCFEVHRDQQGWEDRINGDGGIESVGIGRMGSVGMGGWDQRRWKDVAGIGG